MLARLREKPGPERIEAVTGDMAAARLDGEFSLVYLVFNTIFNLTTQDGQVACFENAAAHLPKGGRFVIEARVPEIQRLPPGQTVLPEDVPLAVELRDGDPVSELSQAGAAATSGAAVVVGV
jgi:hypothetical protein